MPPIRRIGCSRDWIYRNRFGMGRVAGRMVSDCSRVRHTALEGCRESLVRALCFCFFFQAEDGIRDIGVTGVQTCALPIFAIALQREPTHAELGTALGLPEEQIKRMLEAVRQPLSLSTPVGDTGESEFGDFIEDDRIAPPEEQASRSMLERDIFNALNELPDRERTVLDLRYGLSDGQRRTLEEVGRSLGITRERARQIEGEALRRLRASQQGAGLRGYLD